jgi:ribose transport system substrate-binding protein
VRERRIDGTVDQSPFQIGKLAVESALKVIKGEKVPDRIFSTTRLITRDRPPEGGGSLEGIIPVD